MIPAYGKRLAAIPAHSKLHSQTQNSDCENLGEFINKFNIIAMDINSRGGGYIPTGTSFGVIYERNVLNEPKINVPFSKPS